MMDSRKTPSKVARFANSGIGPINWINPWDMSMNGSTVGDGSPPVGLNLELGRGSGHSTKSSGFTIIQLQELRLQALIYKYMEAGLPVPYHLLFPLWKSVASSLGGLSDEVPPGHTSFLGSSTLSWDYRSRTDSDPEPGRCRRTDGKKWRCSKDAAPLKKYCERHMQRGRQRSRKLVDQPSQHLNTSTENAPSANTNLSISLSTDSSSSTLSPRWGFCPNTVLHGGGRYPENNAL